MKACLLILIAGLSCTFSYSQNKGVEYDSSEIKPYLSNYYSLASDTLLPEDVRSCYDAIKTFMDTSDMAIRDFYIAKDYHIDRPFVKMRLYHYSSFVKTRWIDEQNAKDDDLKYRHLGNKSGYDGYLEIDLDRNVVIDYYKWE